MPIPAVHINADRLTVLKKFSAADLVAWRALIACAAARDFLFQPGDALFQFMRRKGGNILAQHDIGQFLARLQIVQVHALWPSGCSPRLVCARQQEPRKP